MEYYHFQNNPYLDVVVGCEYVAELTVVVGGDRCVAEGRRVIVKGRLFDDLKRMF